MRLVGRAAPSLALERGKEVLAQFLWDVILQISGHEEPETFIINGLDGEEIANRKTQLLSHINEPTFMFNECENRWTCSVPVDLP